MQRLTLTAFADFKAGEIGFAENGAVVTAAQRLTPSFGKPVRALADVRAWHLGVFELVAEREAATSRNRNTASPD